MATVPTGVLTGDQVQETFALAKAQGFALPAVNCTNSNTINAVLETARDCRPRSLFNFPTAGQPLWPAKG